MPSGSRSLRAAVLGALVLLFVAAVAGDPAWAQQPPSGEGRIAGRVTDAQSGAGMEGVTVVLNFPAPPDGGAARQELGSTDSDGEYVFTAVPAGRYRIEFLKTGYQAPGITDLEVAAGQESRADSAMSPRADTTAEEDEAGVAPPGTVETITVHGSTAADLLGSIETRTESDQIVNLLSAEEIGKFAAGDIAEAITRVAGINIVEGQFAIIRGLEDRYSSTLYNGAPVPSPDPDKQSAQLDLFPSDMVTSLVVAKNFAPESPSNSSGGSLDILTHDYPGELEAKISVGGGFEEGARDRFLEFQSGSTAGTEADASDVIETDVGGSIGGRHVLFGHEVRFKGLVNHEVDYRTGEGFQEGREPRPQGFDPSAVHPDSGGLALGELALSDGRFEQTESTRDEQLTGYAGLGMDLDADGMHRLDASYFLPGSRRRPSTCARTDTFRASTTPRWPMPPTLGPTTWASRCSSRQPQLRRSAAGSRVRRGRSGSSRRSPRGRCALVCELRPHELLRRGSRPAGAPAERGPPVRSPRRARRQLGGEPGRDVAGRDGARESLLLRALRLLGAVRLPGRCLAHPGPAALSGNRVGPGRG